MLYTLSTSKFITVYQCEYTLNKHSKTYAILCVLLRLPVNQTKNLPGYRRLFLRLLAVINIKIIFILRDQPAANFYRLIDNIALCGEKCINHCHGK